MLDRQYSVTEIQMPASHSECWRLRRLISQLAVASRFNPPDVADVALAVGEAFSNAVKYGTRNSKVRVRVEDFDRELAVVLEYHGPRFDTSVRLPRDVTTARGGFGRYIMQQVTDGMCYEFYDGHTVLRLTKRR